MAVRRPKASERLAATLYSPPETWISKVRALRKGMMPGSRRWTSAPRERRSRLQLSVRMFRSVMGRKVAEEEPLGNDLPRGGNKDKYRNQRQTRMSDPPVTSSGPCLLPGGFACRLV